MNQPPFNPLKELANDTSGLTHRANKRLRKWMEYHNEAYERKNCPVGGCDPTLDPSYKGEKPVKPSSNEIKCWGESIMCCPSDEWMAEIKIDWNNVRERMNDWARETQNSESLRVFFAFTECVCEELARQDDPPLIDERKIKHKNALEGHHEFFYEICKETEYLVPRINTILLDHLWGWVQDQGNIKLEEIEFGIDHAYTNGYPDYDKPIKACVRVKASFL